MIFEKKHLACFDSGDIPKKFELSNEPTLEELEFGCKLNSRRIVCPDSSFGKRELLTFGAKWVPLYTHVSDSNRPLKFLKLKNMGEIPTLLQVATIFGDTLRLSEVRIK